MKSSLPKLLLLNFSLTKGNCCMKNTSLQNFLLKKVHYSYKIHSTSMCVLIWEIMLLHYWLDKYHSFCHIMNGRNIHYYSTALEALHQRVLHGLCFLHQTYSWTAPWDGDWPVKKHGKCDKTIVHLTINGILRDLEVISQFSVRAEAMAASKLTLTSCGDKHVRLSHKKQWE